MIIAIGSADKNLFNDRFQNKKLIQFIKVKPLSSESGLALLIRVYKRE